MKRRVTWLVPLTAWLVSSTFGCSSCEKDKPYVPYAIDPGAVGSGPASSEGFLEPPPPEQKIETFSAVVAKRFDGAKSASTTGGTVSAPAGQVIDLLLDADLTTDGKSDPIAWLRSADGSTGELVQFVATREGGPFAATSLVQLPADLAIRSGCQPSTDLRQIGPRTAAITFRRTCTEGTRTVTTEWVAAVVPMRSPAMRFQLLVVDQPPDEQLETVLDALDRDGDQFDDLLVTLAWKGSRRTFEEPPTDNVAVTLRYFDRPAGLSRDPHEPASSFTSFAQRLERMAKGSGRDGVAPLARTARQLHHAVCAEGSRPRLTVLGDGVQCGSRDAMLRMTTAEMDAALGAKDTLAAVGAFDRLRGQGAGAKELDAARKRLEKAAPLHEVQSYHLPFGPAMNPQGSSWSPLAFHQDGSLLIRTDASVMRFDAKLRIALAAHETGPMAPWAVRVEAPGSSASFEGIEVPMAGGLLRARLIRGGEALEAPLPLDATAPVVIARPVAWTSTGLSLLTGLGPVWVATDGAKAKRQAPEPSPWVMGSPRSPDGKVLVHASSLGVVVIGPEGKTSVWKTGAMASGYENLLGCAVSNGAAAVACIDGTMTRVFVNGG
jgi:hypothetical protein